MERDLAKHMVAVGFHSLSLLESLIPILKQHCDPDEYSKYLAAIGAISAEFSVQIFREIFSDHPDLEVEVDNTLKKFGQFM